MGSKGSSNMAKMSLAYDGILSHDCQQNPDFCMWNVVAFLYCDGGSFLGKGFCCFSLHIYFFREKVDKREKKTLVIPIYWYCIQHIY